MGLTDLDLYAKMESAICRAADCWNCCRGTCTVGLLGVRFGHPLALGQLGAHLLPLILFCVSVSRLPVFVHGIFLFIFVCFHLWVLIPLFIHVGVLPIFIRPPFLTPTTPTYRVYLIFPKWGIFFCEKKLNKFWGQFSRFLPRILSGFLGRLGTTHVFKVVPLAAYLAQMLEGFAQVFPDSSIFRDWCSQTLPHKNQVGIPIQKTGLWKLTQPSWNGLAIVWQGCWWPPTKAAKGVSWLHFESLGSIVSRHKHPAF